jgi:hypothetical protein
VEIFIEVDELGVELLESQVDLRPFLPELL